FKKQRFQELNDIQNNIATAYGAPKNRFEMGKSVQESVMDTWNQIKQKDGELIGALNEKYGKEALYPSKFIDATANPVGAGTSQDVRKATLDPQVLTAQKIIRNSGGVLTFDDLAELKQMLGNALEPGLQKNVNDAQVAQLYNAVRSDMENHIKTRSPDDFRMLKESNARYSSAMKDFTQHFKKLVGTKDIPVSSERAYEIISGAATESGRGDLKEFQHVWDAMSPETRGSLSATVLTRLGATDKGNPNNMETWSIGKFLSGYRNLSPEAKDMLFSQQGQSKTRDALEDLVVVTNNVQQKMLNLASTSRSAAGAIMLGQFGLGGIISHLSEGSLTSGLLWGLGGPYA